MPLEGASEPRGHDNWLLHKVFDRSYTSYSKDKTTCWNTIGKACVLQLLLRRGVVVQVLEHLLAATAVTTSSYDNNLSG
ncbi:hypothetical protein PoB_002672900 [Plakobranchus ocellatus]|uniref:Uncharacterized protein n=1 Tax=Plakobranchus ocellatus TaxID=259542 RepID=A0AAV4A1Z1_9GAST|nr:hypothetical protein PoB_002672900 [Plakobranchus ocellatus]